jgi:demethylmenaquinone methyltransferase / 2-methoxy-6-polyprenyl-1,4-benzoquinol methylase
VIRAGEGTTPKGAANEEQAARYVRSMFGEVAHRYDLLNHLLSFQADRYWRAATVRRLQPILGRKGTRSIDLCCGTGDLLLALRSSAHPESLVLGSDFCHPMLEEAARKASSKGARVPLLEGDAMRLPLPDRSLDLITVAFGFRNLTNYRKGLEEFRRVLKPGGTLAILEFSTPPNPLFRAFYGFYSTKVLPVVGGWVSGASDAYKYLPDSVRKFPSAEVLAAELEGSGFTRVEFKRMTFGIVALHTGLSG